MEHELERLTSTEGLALAGLLRILIRADGRFTDEERGALRAVASSVAIAEEGAPVSDVPIGERKLYALIERAGVELGSDASIRAAASEVTRPSARAAIHALLFEVAASDVISAGEATLLDWVAEEWELETPRDLPGEETDAG